MVALRFSEIVRKVLCCPACHGNLELAAERFICDNPSCRSVFTIIDGIPVLIDDHTSIFSQEDLVAMRRTAVKEQGISMGRRVVQLLPRVGWNLRAKNNYGKFLAAISELTDIPRVLVVGGGTLGDGMEVLTERNDLELVETDVSFGPRTTLICDAHSLPFEDESFDGVIVQAVLEHVVEPYRCVEEIYRVIRKQGVV